MSGMIPRGGIVGSTVGVGGTDVGEREVGAAMSAQRP